MEVLVFELDHSHYAIPLEVVQEIVRAVAITPLPGAPSVVEGVINLRGVAVPVWNVRSRFGHPPRSIRLTDQLIIARVGPRLWALRVDRTIGLQTLPAAELADVRQLVPGAEYVRWIATGSQNIVLIQDVHRFLTETETELIEASLRSQEVP